MEKLKLVIFDMDGLIFDTERIAFASWKKAASAYGYDISEELFKRTIGSNVKRSNEIYMAHFGDGFPVDIIREARYKEGERIISSDGVQVKKGLYSLLNYLKEIKLKMAIATSTSRHRAVSLLTNAGIEHYFDYILCGDEIKNSKPDPEIFLKVAEKLDCIPESCIVLEDSIAGITAAHRAKMRSIMVPDMVEPTAEVISLIFKQFKSLEDVKLFMEETYEKTRQIV